jgi:CRP-like cAMP-binding protein
MSQSAVAYLDIPAGQTVFAEGDQGQTMYIVESGAVDLLLAARGKEPIASFGPGEFFGEMSLLDDQPRFASAVTSAPTRLLKIERSDFPELLRGNVEIGVKMLRMLARRHQQCEMRLASALVEGAAQKRKSGAQPAVAAPTPKTEQSAATPPKSKQKPAPEPSPTTIEPPQAAAPAPMASPRSRGGCLLRHAKGQVFTLNPELNEFLVGRPDAAAGINPQVNLGDLDPTRSLSRRHAKLVRQGQLFFVREESGTVNGTFVNEVRVKTGVDVPIKPGDRIRFGAVEVEFAAA